MTIDLTTPQQQALDAGGETLPRVRDPRTMAEYVLVPFGEYETVRELLDDDRRQRAIRRTARRNAAGRAGDQP
jgi:hypothetical protein